MTQRSSVSVNSPVISDGQLIERKQVFETDSHNQFKQYLVGLVFCSGGIVSLVTSFDCFEDSNQPGERRDLFSW